MNAIGSGKQEEFARLDGEKAKARSKQLIERG